MKAVQNVQKKKKIVAAVSIQENTVVAFKNACCFDAFRLALVKKKKNGERRKKNGYLKEKSRAVIGLEKGSMRERHYSLKSVNYYITTIHGIGTLISPP